MQRTLERILKTDDSLGPTILRVSLGTVMFAHGAQKALGWFGGYGYGATMDYLTGPGGLPWLIAFLVIAIELVGSLALIAGAGGRAAALGVGAVMLGAILTVHAKVGFFMNWGGAQPGEGYEYHLLAIALAAGVVIAGSGAYSVDRWLTRKLESRSPATSRAGEIGARWAS
jgi:putative oxidoreductase